jgi:hypothetical protein
MILMIIIKKKRGPREEVERMNERKGKEEEIYLFYLSILLKENRYKYFRHLLQIEINLKARSEKSFFSRAEKT